MTKDDKIFTVAHQYELYLERVGLSEERMNPVQRIETRRAFYGGFSQFLMMMHHELMELPEDELGDAVESMVEECGDFWWKES